MKILLACGGWKKYQIVPLCLVTYYVLHAVYQNVQEMTFILTTKTYYWGHIDSKYIFAILIDFRIVFIIQRLKSLFHISRINSNIKNTADMVTATKTVMLGSIHSFLLEGYNTFTTNTMSQILLLPVMVTSSLSCRNLRVFPSLSWIGLVPFQLSSSIEPYESAVWKNAVLLK